jgi:hypothetical protein
MANRSFYGVILRDRETARLELDVVVLAKEMHLSDLIDRDDYDDDEVYQSDCDKLDFGDVLERLSADTVGSLLRLCSPARVEIANQLDFPSDCVFCMPGIDDSELSFDDILFGFPGEFLLRAAQGLEPPIRLTSRMAKDMQWFSWDHDDDDDDDIDY